MKKLEKKPITESKKKKKTETLWEDLMENKMKIPETYEEYLKTPKAYLKKLIESDNSSFEDMMTLYTFNKQAIKEKEKMSTSEDSFVQKNTLWEELREDLRDGL